MTCPLCVQGMDHASCVRPARATGRGPFDAPGPLTEDLTHYRILFAEGHLGPIKHFSQMSAWQSAEMVLGLREDVGDDVLPRPVVIVKVTPSKVPLGMRMHARLATR